MTQMDLAPGMVLLDRTTEPGGGYVELSYDGRLRAGYWKETAKPYETAESALTHFKEAFQHSQNPATYEVIKTLETYLEQKDDGR